MKIVVCIKQVVDISFPFLLDPDTIVPVQEDIFYKINPADLCAMEAALITQETHGGEVIVLSYGPERVEKALRECLAMGGDQVIRIGEERLDPYSQAKAYLLAKAVASLLPDLVLCGSRSLDEGTGETPIAIAEHLDYPQVTGVMKLEFLNNGQTALVEKKLEKGRRETIECPLPVVLSLEPGILQPRYAAMPGILKAHKSEVSQLNKESMEIDCSEQLAFNALRRQVRQSLPRPRPKRSFSLESGMTAEQRMEMMMSGGLKKSNSDLLEGAAKDLGKQLSGILQEKIYNI
jgi:electron transfer flavoprotein beta subunit